MPDADDNCPLEANADQADADEDGLGDACDEPEAEEPTGGGCALITVTPASDADCTNDGANPDCTLQAALNTASNNAEEDTISIAAGLYTTADNAGNSFTYEAAVLPVIVEELDVRKRFVETGRVRVTKTVDEREEVVDEPLRREEVDVERVAVNRLVDGPVELRQEGDTLVIPLLEEVLVVEKRLMLREELRVTRRAVEEHRPRRVVLRSERATVERLPAAPADDPGAASE